ncbi:MAG: cyclic nucleotide-binding domain-containing protein [Candidatus Contendobacter sp.]|nr:cyclic nucleotide-binding domain-containing protein [Candidatus Contendobacter sp.]MDS4030142.1 cyclic nucleotide-binding domain-containing protein [Candidatus Contendobacter sp.]MDS4057217.1 cyclic nucleotide-binding domain-containing protein [Candidatus Contendobacter sp.]
MQHQDLSNQIEKYQSFAQGEIIFREGDPGDCLYIVAEGRADIVVDNLILETVEAGGILGELALIDDRPRSARAVAHTDCVLTSITRQHFLNLVQRTPLFALQVMRVMAERLRRANVRARA